MTIVTRYNVLATAVAGLVAVMGCQAKQPVVPVSPLSASPVMPTSAMPSGMPAASAMPPPFIPIQSDPLSSAPSIVPSFRPTPVMVARVPSQGPITLQGGPFSVATQGLIAEPISAVNADTGDVLVVWQDDGQRGLLAPVSPGLTGCLVTAGGRPKGEPFQIIGGAGANGHPQMAWNPVAKSFSLVWTDNGSAGSSVMLVRIGPDGHLLPGVHTLARDGRDARLAVDTLTGKTLFAWTSTRATGSNTPENDVYGLVWAADGATVRAEFGICVQPQSQSVFDLVVNPERGEFTVAWGDNRPYGLTLQRVTSVGVISGNAVSLTPDADSGILAYNRKTHAYLLVTHDRRYVQPTLFAQQLTADLVPIGDNRTIAAGQDVGTLRGVLVEPNTGVYVLMWSVGRTRANPQPAPQPMATGDGTIWESQVPFGGETILQRLTSDARPLGEPFTLAVPPSQAPIVAYSPAANAFLGLWSSQQAFGLQGQWFGVSE